MANPVGWFEIYVDDITRAKNFYETVLQVKLDPLGAPGGEEGLEMWSFPMDMEGTGSSGALCKMNGVNAGGNSVMVYFSCADCSVEASRVADAGGKIMKEKMSIGEYGFIALAFDTENNMFGLHSLS